MTVKYTDIDYVVFTDAARYITEGKSPYLRETYRYTPLLAIILTPNIYLFYSFGKCLFALTDLLVGYLIHRILLSRGMTSKRAVYFEALWLLNPMVANISTRGNAESLLGAMVLGTLYLMLQKHKHFYSACALFGLSVHFKIYPIIYAAPILILLDKQTTMTLPWIMQNYQAWRFQWMYSFEKTIITRPLKSVFSFLSPIRILFACISATFFFALTGFMYFCYGHDFLEHSYLYHVTREDHRHNFSIWFYPLYLGMDNKSPWMGLLAFVPQITLVISTGIIFGKDVFFACFLQTFLFVTYNKVITSQYFMWYICLFPLILPSTEIQMKWKGTLLLLSWIAGQGIWLNYAYQLEFLAQHTFFQLWVAGSLFFIINAWVMVELIKQHKYEPVFNSNDKIRWVWGMGDPGTKRF